MTCNKRTKRIYGKYKASVKQEEEKDFSILHVCARACESKREIKSKKRKEERKREREKEKWGRAH